MKKILCLALCVVLFPALALSMQLMTDEELEAFVAQSGIVLEVLMQGAMGEPGLLTQAMFEQWDALSDAEQAVERRNMIEAWNSMSDEDRAIIANRAFEIWAAMTKEERDELNIDIGEHIGALTPEERSIVKAFVLDTVRNFSDAQKQVLVEHIRDSMLAASQTLQEMHRNLNP
ncbi:MAG: DUF3106 domain-containing protein [Desulfatibacillaceae bacterium]|nr:DUF3106 domain-containing protein [Desulfatibacillaceae bacterium]